VEGKPTEYAEMYECEEVPHREELENRKTVPLWYQARADHIWHFKVNRPLRDIPLYSARGRYKGTPRATTT